MTTSNIEETNTPPTSAGLALYQISSPQDSDAPVSSHEKAPARGQGFSIRRLKAKIKS
jgi:hypothetical protein